ncbi:MAG TPA: hypothetical protein VL461_06245 [Dictyobacter sp.]|jgi:hypothetical protein|nr:hypothetical protein [Dictyobacter sp.]
MSFLDYNTLQWRRVHFACALPGCTVAQHTGSDFCAHHWQRDLVMGIAGYLHNVGSLLKVQEHIDALQDAQQIALHGSDVSVAAFVLAYMSKDMQTFLGVSQRDVAAIQKKAMVAA